MLRMFWIKVIEMAEARWLALMSLLKPSKLFDHRQGVSDTTLARPRVLRICTCFQSESYDTVLGFNMRSSRAAKALWRCSVERHGFFRLRGPRRRPLLAVIGSLAGISQPTVMRTETQAISDAARMRCSNRSFVRFVVHISYTWLVSFYGGEEWATESRVFNLIDD